jgi:hypothetical protein
MNFDNDKCVHININCNLLYLTLARCASLGSTHTTDAPDRSAASVLVPASVTRDMRAMWNWRLWD